LAPFNPEAGLTPVTIVGVVNDTRWRSIRLPVEPIMYRLGRDYAGYLVVRYDSAFALMADLRRMGATNILVERRRTPTRCATLLRMAQLYSERFADPDGRIRATFDIIWLSGWAPHASQQQPLKPGSAKASLAEAVKRLAPE
jgi:hypothetical protein